MLASRLALLSASLALAAHVSSDHDEKVLQANTPDRSYHLGERFPVECLNRTLESGEHVGLGVFQLDFDLCATDNGCVWRARICAVCDLRRDRETVAVRVWQRKRHG